MHAECAAAMVALVALAHCEAQASVTAHAQAFAAAAASRGTSTAAGRAGLKSPFGRTASRQPSSRRRLVRLATLTVSEQGPSHASLQRRDASTQHGPARNHPAPRIDPACNWSRRLLDGGCWRLLARCLDVMPASPHLQQVVSAGLMLLAREVAAVHAQVWHDFWQGLLQTEE